MCPRPSPCQDRADQAAIEVLRGVRLFGSPRQVRGFGTTECAPVLVVVQVVHRAALHLDLTAPTRRRDGCGADAVWVSGIAGGRAASGLRARAVADPKSR